MVDNFQEFIWSLADVYFTLYTPDLPARDNNPFGKKKNNIPSTYILRYINNKLRYALFTVVLIHLKWKAFNSTYRIPAFRSLSY